MNWIVRLHAAPAATGVVVSQVVLSPRLAFIALSEEIVSGRLPLLLRVTVCGALLLPTAVPAKLKLGTSWTSSLCTEL